MASPGKALAPVFWEAELTNLVWMAIRAGVLPWEDGGRFARLPFFAP